MATESRMSMVRSAALLMVVLGGSGAAVAGSKSASMRVGVQVVSSLRLVASATPAGSLGVEMSSYGAKAGAVLVQQRSGTPLRLQNGARLPSESDSPLMLADGSSQLPLRQSAGPAEVVVTVFADGNPPRGN